MVEQTESTRKRHNISKSFCVIFATLAILITSFCTPVFAVELETQTIQGQTEKETFVIDGEHDITIEQNMILGNILILNICQFVALFLIFGAIIAFAFWIHLK